MVEASQVAGVGQVVGHDPGLVVGNVLELVRAGHIAQGPDAIHVGAPVRVNGDPTVLVGGDAGGVQTELFSVGHPAGGHEQNVPDGIRPVCEVQVDLTLSSADRGQRGTQANVPLLPRDRGESPLDLGVELAKHRIAPCDDRDLTAKS